MKSIPIVHFKSLLLLGLASMGGSQVLSQEIIPGGLESAGLTRIVPDTRLFETENANLANWEPFTSVVGNSFFVVEANTFAEGSSENQQYGVALQKVSGGAPVSGYAFFGDNGMVYGGKINGSRQNGNPGRVAGDRRPGATHFIVGGEASPHIFDAFQGDGRWNLGFDRLVDGRYCAVQIFDVNPDTLERTASSVVMDVATGRVTSGTAPGNQIARFGGEVVCLDNGNFVAIADDRSTVHFGGTAAVAAIFGPDGSLVKDSFVIGDRGGELWSNVASFKGGFCVRYNGVMIFYSNDGVLLGESDTDDAVFPPTAAFGANQPIGFDRGRGDATRIGAHINSPFVYLAGKQGDVWLAVWDSRNQAFLGVINVNEIIPDFNGVDEVNFTPEGIDRVNIAVDALDRITVTFEANVAGNGRQVCARVLQFNYNSESPSESTFEHLTPTFFPFQNFNNGTENPGLAGQVVTERSTVAMTTKEICIAAKGVLDSDGNFENGAETFPQTTVYTVFSHPAPAEDPTVPAVVVDDEPIVITGLSRSGGDVTLTWEGGAGPFLVRKATDLGSGLWTVVASTDERTLTVASADDAAFFQILGEITFNLSLSAENVNGTPVDSPGLGSGTVRLSGTTLSVNLSYSNLTGNSTLAHIHGPARPDQNAGVLVNLAPVHVGEFGSTSGSFSGNLTVTLEQASHILNGLTYVNIHSSTFGGGEIRGQID